MTDPAIVYVHGLWLTGVESWWLRHRICSQRACEWHTFHYASTHTSMADIGTALRTLVESIDAPAVHLLGHSMGGVVIMRMLAQGAEFPPGRAVFMGTPAQPSQAARTLRAHLLGRMVLGAAAVELAGDSDRRWTSERELGLIVGTHAFGLAQLVVKFDEPNDGVVTVAETALPGARARLELPLSHTGMLMSARAADEVLQFLDTGAFSA
jgi:pimeloyl-ACP methyl ester carboxylesterase